MAPSVNVTLVVFEKSMKDIETGGGISFYVVGIFPIQDQVSKGGIKHYDCRVFQWSETAYFQLICF